VPLIGAEVVYREPIQVEEGEEVGLCQIEDVNIVPDRRPIGRIVICPKDLDPGQFPLSHIEEERDEVGLWVMILASGG